LLAYVIEVSGNLRKCYFDRLLAIVTDDTIYKIDEIKVDMRMLQKEILTYVSSILLLVL